MSIKWKNYFNSVWQKKEIQLQLFISLLLFVPIPQSLFLGMEDPARQVKKLKFIIKCQCETKQTAEQKYPS